MEVIARAKYVRRTPRKARIVADAVVGMRVSEALAQLEFSPRHAAADVAKVIKSAAANAEHNYNLSRDDLVVKQLLVDEGPTMKRFRPVSRGMAHQYFRRTSHITAVVEDRPAPPPVRRPERRRRRADEAPADAPARARRSAPKPPETIAEEVAEQPIDATAAVDENTAPVAEAPEASPAATEDADASAATEEEASPSPTESEEETT
jgi:large subunit ribosomal protein L22